MKDIIKWLDDHKQTISFIESMTGGALSYELVKQPGASHVYHEGCITYSIDAKVAAGVDSKIIQTYGVVSKETAEAMVYALSNKVKADFYVSVTGNAGPTKQDDKADLEAYFSVLSQDKIETFHIDFDEYNNRTTNIKNTIKEIKKQIKQKMKNKINIYRTDI